MKVKYLGPGDRLVAYGRTLSVGDSAVFDDAETRMLRAQPHIHITVDGEVLPPLPLLTGPDYSRPSAHGSRRQWTGYAEKLGVEVDDEMTRDAIVAAVDAPEETENEIVAADTSVPGASEALPGEGHTPSDKEKK